MLSQRDLSRIYWLSGTPCGGKTSVASAIAKKRNWAVCHSDDYFDDHCSRAHPDRHPIFYKISRLTGDDLWLRSIEAQIATEQPFHDEQFDLVQEDLSKLLRDDSRPIIYEGVVSPRILKPILPSMAHVFYLIPNEEFQIEKYSQRTFIHAVLAKTSNRELAWENWMARDAALAESFREQVQQNRVPWLLVDGQKSLAETISLVEANFLGC